MSKAKRVVVIGAGIGGLVAAVELAIGGCEVTVLERAAEPGGKMRTLTVDGRQLDVGPTVFTMRWVFDEIFAEAGTSLESFITLDPVSVLARHTWSETERLDLFADIAQSSDAIGAFAGAIEARAYVAFCKRAQATYDTLKTSYILAAKPTPLSLTAGAGLSGLADLWRISPFATLWKTLGDYFKDARLRQLFARYATYCGSSPFDAPATLMLISHVEREGVWIIDGGIHRLAKALEKLARMRGATFRYESEVREINARGGKTCGVTLTSGERIECDAIIANSDTNALSAGLLGADAAKAINTSSGPASLSAVTWALVAKTRGFPLARHNVFFSDDYRSEFEDLFSRKQIPSKPTVYVCAEDRHENSASGIEEERIFILINAPPTGDIHAFDKPEIVSCAKRAFGLLQRCGLSIEVDPNTMAATTPRDFAKLFPGTGGALYGRASHGWAASFARPTAKTRLEGLYLAGGSVHPGPGVPMAAISGRLAATQLLSDIHSTPRFHGMAMPGGISTR
ncbi:1-hydroxycarotenoid 3,4-desaturase CrtD [Hyphomicrobium sp.]|jgi:1-hydroxycarotenoid 3,4-desaturase|uniref:1-hydroxycarotenoid 3,4-desaturase CrtD n=1 Tax=Hyphomicrobium sp. TaxID=82 RepID=UPI003564E0B5